jgi:hypothetical protein
VDANVQDACILAAAWWEHCDFQPGAAGPTRDAAHGRSDRERKCCTRLLNQFTNLLKLSPSFGHSAFHIITSYALVNAPPRFSSFASMYLSLSKMVPPHRTATSHPRAVSMLGVQGAASADGVLRCCGVIERAWKIRSSTEMCKMHAFWRQRASVVGGRTPASICGRCDQS